MTDRNIVRTAISIGKYQVCSLIEQGISIVYKVFNPDDNIFYAIKIFNKKNKSAMRQYMNETTVLKNIKYYNRVEFITFIEDLANVKIYYSDKSYEIANGIVLEYASNGCLFDFVLNSNTLNEVTARSIFKQIVKCVDELHCMNLVHRDIKLENFLIDENFNIKLCDFGFACPIFNAYGNKLKMNIYQGTKGYIAPEIKKEQDIYYDGQKIDIFALGIILFILCTKVPPIENSSTCRWYQLIKSKQYEKFWQYKQERDSSFSLLSSEFKNLVEGLLCYDFTKRLTLSQLKNHSWFNKETISITLEN